MSTLECMRRSISDDVDVPMSNGGMDLYRLVSDKHLYWCCLDCPLGEISSVNLIEGTTLLR